MNDRHDTTHFSFKIALACGGTGGHLFPGVAVADVLKQNGHEVLLILSDKKVDRAAAASLGHPSITLPSVAWQKGKRLRFLFGFPKVLRQCRRVFHEHRPDAVLAMGGFTSLAPVLTARRMKKPVFLHESNAFPGRAIRMLARWADMGFVGFDKTISRIPGVPCHVTGTPVRETLRHLNREACCHSLGFQADRPVLLVTGGSQGALAINRLMLANLGKIKETFPDLQVMHLCGLNEDLDEVRKKYDHHGIDARVHDFFDRMDLALGAATAAIGRSGASFMAELVAAGLPSMLIPFPYAADNHQLENALSLSESGAAVYFDEQTPDADVFLRNLETLLKDTTQRASMREAMLGMDHPDSAQMIVSHISTFVGSRLPMGKVSIPSDSKESTFDRSSEPQSIRHISTAS